MDPEHLISLKLNSEPHLHTDQKWEYYPPHPSNPNNSVQACPIRNTSASIVSSGGEVNMAALWAALSGGISAEATSID